MLDRGVFKMSLGALAQGCCIGVIRAYQVVVAPLLPAACRFQPSCSEYAIEAVRKHGAVGGSVLAAKRVVRCQPLCKGGYDPVP